MKLDDNPNTAREQILLYVIAGAGLILAVTNFGIAAAPLGLVPFFVVFAYIVWRARRANAKGARK